MLLSSEECGPMTCDPTYLMHDMLNTCLFIECSKSFLQCDFKHVLSGLDILKFFNLITDYISCIVRYWWMISMWDMSVLLNYRYYYLYNVNDIVYTYMFRNFIHSFWNFFLVSCLTYFPIFIPYVYIAYLPLLRCSPFSF